MTFFQALTRTRACLLSLSMHQVVAQRVRIMPSAPIVIEIDRPLEVIGLEVLTKIDYAAVEFCGCSVVWRVRADA